GALLASPRRRGSAALPFLQNVVAAPGLAHTLLDVGDRSRPAVDEVGIFAPITGEGAAGPRHAILCPGQDGEYLYAGTEVARRVGRVYPSADVCELAEAMPGVDGACVVAVPSARATFSYRFVLIVFGARPPSRG